MSTKQLLRRGFRRGLWLTVPGVLLGVNAAARAQFFTGLGHLPQGTVSDAYGVSLDGHTVVGYSNDAVSQRAFRWTFAGGMESLAQFTGETFSNGLGAVTGGGEVVGYSRATGEMHAIRWSSGSITELLPLPGNALAYAMAVSADGSVVAGSSIVDATGSSPRTAVRWVNGDQPISLGLVNGSTSTYTNAMSADGAVVVGFANGASFPSRAFRWTAGTGMVNLGVLTGQTLSVAYGVSPDGSTVVGTSGSRAMAWTGAGGMRDLGLLANGDFGGAHGVSNDGTVIVGFSRDGTTAVRAVMWTPAGGPIDIKNRLTSLGVNMQGWDLNYARSVSADGSVIVGAGHHNNYDEAWIAVIPPPCGSADFNHDGDTGTDADIEAFFACLSGSCCPTCGSVDFNGDGDVGTDADIDAFFRVLAGGTC